MFILQHIETFSADELAVACAKAMWEEDHVAQNLGMTLDLINPGKAQISMPVGGDMINGHEICHGGYIFILADSAFAYACNSHNQFCVAQHCDISFLRSAKKNDTLSALASERVRQGRTGICDITVTNQLQEIVAEFRGISRTIKGEFIPQQKIKSGE
jgi:acyl-CoA thioesterase